MGKVKNIFMGLAFLGAVTTGSVGCSNVDIEQKTVTNLDQVFKDVDGDGKNDLMFVIRETPMLGSWHYVFYRRNLGDGKFGEPHFLYRVQWDVDIPFETIRGNGEREKYLRNLIKKAMEESTPPYNKN